MMKDSSEAIPPQPLPEEEKEEEEDCTLSSPPQSSPPEETPDPVARITHDPHHQATCTSQTIPGTSLLSSTLSPTRPTMVDSEQEEQEQKEQSAQRQRVGRPPVLFKEDPPVSSLSDSSSAASSSSSSSALLSSGSAAALSSSSLSSLDRPIQPPQRRRPGRGRSCLGRRSSTTTKPFRVLRSSSVWHATTTTTRTRPTTTTIKAPQPAQPAQQSQRLLSRAATPETRHDVESQTTGRQQGNSTSSTVWRFQDQHHNHNNQSQNQPYNPKRDNDKDNDDTSEELVPLLLPDPPATGNPVAQAAATQSSSSVWGLSSSSWTAAATISNWVPHFVVDQRTTSTAATDSLWHDWTRWTRSEPFPNDTTTTNNHNNNNNTGKPTTTTSTTTTTTTIQPMVGGHETSTTNNNWSWPRVPFVRSTDAVPSRDGRMCSQQQQEEQNPNETKQEPEHAATATTSQPLVMVDPNASSSYRTMEFQAPIRLQDPGATRMTAVAQAVSSCSSFHSCPPMNEDWNNPVPIPEENDKDKDDWEKSSNLGPRFQFLHDLVLNHTCTSWAKDTTATTLPAATTTVREPSLLSPAQSDNTDRTRTGAPPTASPRTQPAADPSTPLSSSALEYWMGGSYYRRLLSSGNTAAAAVDPSLGHIHNNQSIPAVPQVQKNQHAMEPDGDKDKHNDTDGNQSSLHCCNRNGLDDDDDLLASPARPRPRLETAPARDVQASVPSITTTATDPWTRACTAPNPSPTMLNHTAAVESSSPAQMEEESTGLLLSHSEGKPNRCSTTTHSSKCVVVTLASTTPPLSPRVRRIDPIPGTPSSTVRRGHVTDASHVSSPQPAPQNTVHSSPKTLLEDAETESISDMVQVLHQYLSLIERQPSHSDDAVSISSCSSSKPLSPASLGSFPATNTGGASDAVMRTTNDTPHVPPLDTVPLNQALSYLQSNQRPILFDSEMEEDESGEGITTDNGNEADDEANGDDRDGTTPITTGNPVSIPPLSDAMVPAMDLDNSNDDDNDSEDHVTAASMALLRATLMEQQLQEQKLEYHNYHGSPTTLMMDQMLSVSSLIHPTSSSDSNGNTSDTDTTSNAAEDTSSCGGSVQPMGLVFFQQPQQQKQVPFKSLLSTKPSAAESTPDKQQDHESSAIVKPQTTKDATATEEDIGNSNDSSILSDETDSFKSCLLALSTSEASCPNTDDTSNSELSETETVAQAQNRERDNDIPPMHCPQEALLDDSMSNSVPSNQSKDIENVSESGTSGNLAEMCLSVARYILWCMLALSLALSLAGPDKLQALSLSMQRRQQEYFSSVNVTQVYLQLQDFTKPWTESAHSFSEMSLVRPTLGVVLRNTVRLTWRTAAMNTKLWNPQSTFYEYCSSTLRNMWRELSQPYESHGPQTEEAAS